MAKNVDSGLVGADGKSIIVAFPDSTSNDFIEAHIKAMHSNPAIVANTPSWNAEVTDPNSLSNSGPVKFGLRAGARTLPFVGGGLGSMAGGIPGSMIGGMAGQGAENLIEQKVLGQPAKNFEQNATDIGKAGLEQGVFSVLAEIPGASANALKEFAAAKKAARVLKGGKAAAEIEAAANMRPELEAALQKSQAARKVASDATLNAVQDIQQHVGPISSGELTDQLANRISQKVDGPKNTKILQTRIRQRVKQLVSQSTHGTVRANEAFNLDELHLANQHLRSLNSAEHAAQTAGTSKGGFKFDQALEDAISETLGEVVPNYKELNGVTSGHIQDVQAISKELGKNPRKVLQDIQTEQAKRVGEARAANNVSKSYVGVHPGIPPSVYVKPGGLESLATGSANLINSPLVRWPFFQYGPRALGGLGAALSTPAQE